MDKELNPVKAAVANQIVIRKANELIVSKSNSSLLENILVSIGLSRMTETTSGDVLACIYPRELTRIMGTNSGDDNIYTRLKTVAKSITGHSIVVEDGKGNFSAFPLVKTANYVNGVFTIYFHENSKPLITNLRSNFTTMNLLTLARFKSNYSFRIYEILLKEAYRIPRVPGGYAEITYNISELRFMISVASVDEERVKKELDKYGNTDDIDWDRLYDLTKVRKVEKWNNFKDRVIEKARKELLEKADICFDAEYLRGEEGRSYKYVKFKIYFNTPAKPIENYGLKEKILLKQEGHQLDIDEVNHPELFENYLGHNGLTSRDLKILLHHAGQNEELVGQAISMADSQKVRIENYMGWIVSCIQRNFEGPIAVFEGSADSAREWKEFKEEIEEEWTKPGFKASLWKKIKEYDDFGDFIKSMRMTASQMEQIWTPDRCVDVYFEYKKHEKGI